MRDCTRCHPPARRAKPVGRGSGGGACRRPAMRRGGVGARVEGYRKPWYLSSTSTRLTGLAVIEAFGARFRQEDMFRDLKQRLGAEGGRGWTKEPVPTT